MIAFALKWAVLALWTTVMATLIALCARDAFGLDKPRQNMHRSERFRFDRSARINERVKWVTRRPKIGYRLYASWPRLMPHRPHSIINLCILKTLST